MSIVFSPMLKDIVEHEGLPSWTSRDVLNHYRRLFQDHADKSILAEIERLVETWRRIVAEGEAAEEQMAIFEAALRHSNECVWDTAYDFLKQMLKSNVRIREILLRVLEDKAWRSRFNVVASCGELPGEIRDAILRKGFADKSRRVRVKAADVALRFRLNAYVPQMQELCEAESDPGTKRIYRQYIDFLRQGYHLEERPDGKVSLWVAAGRELRGAVLDKADAAGEKLEKAIERVRDGRI